MGVLCSGKDGVPMLASAPSTTVLATEGERPTPPSGSAAAAAATSSKGTSGTWGYSSWRGSCGASALGRRASGVG